MKIKVKLFQKKEKQAENRTERNSGNLLRVICVNLKELLSIIEEIWKHLKKKKKHVLKRCIQMENDEKRGNHFGGTERSITGRQTEEDVGVSACV